MLFYIICVSENVFPSIISNMQEQGMEHCHITIPANFSLTFFAHLRMDFPFVIENLIKEGEDYMVILTISNSGQISLSENFRNNAGTIIVNNTVIFSDNISDFNKLKIENTFLFLMSSKFQDVAHRLEQDRNILDELLEKMSKIHVRLTRKVLFEKSKKIH